MDGQCVMNATVPKPNIPSNNSVAPNEGQLDGFSVVKQKSSKPRKFEGVSVYKKLEYRPIGKQKVNEVQKVNESTPIARPMVNKHLSSLSFNAEEDSMG
ncbi:hypothetical protein Tco_0910458 [Tanacetum coccineum]|uniref:Uncharacterized protein n=1 Tax=Tanacetum coccineum TaxID=301880 RepID=A0ABQ5CV77_9ASTR